VTARTAAGPALTTVAMWDVDNEELDREPLRGYGLLTDRPLLVALNQEESRAAEPMAADLAGRIAALHGEGLVLSPCVEAEIGSLEPADQAASGAA